MTGAEFYLIFAVIGYPRPAWPAFIGPYFSQEKCEEGGILFERAFGKHTDYWECREIHKKTPDKPTDDDKGHP